MKNILTILLICNLSSLCSQSQIKDIDSRTQLKKEDGLNFYNEESISKLDLIQALEIASVKIHKFQIGEFNKKLRLQIFADKYEDGKLIETDTLLDYNNEYIYFVDEKLKRNFVDQIKFFSKTDDNKSEITLQTYALSTKGKIELEKKRDKQFYLWREYTDTKWKLDEKISLMIFASSWFDESINLDRFCGVVKLNDNDDDTDELLTFSPNYVLINYRISEMTNN
jgi:hypothetical protein